MCQLKSIGLENLVNGRKLSKMMYSENNNTIMIHTVNSVRLLSTQGSVLGPSFFLFTNYLLK